MFVAVSTRTMANAKPKFRQPDKDMVIRDMVQVRREAAERRRQETIICREKAIAEMEALERSYRAARRKLMAKIGKGSVASIHSYAMIEKRICRAFKVSAKDLHANRRHRNVVFARQAMMYWATRLTTLSLPQIGRLMGGRDHTTVLHGYQVYPKKRAEMGRHLRAIYRDQSRQAA